MTEPTVDPGSSSPSRRTWGLVLLGFVLFWVVYLVFFLPKPPGGGGGTAVPPEVASWTLHDRAGAPVTFGQFKGKAVFLNVWATWCPPCVGEMPSIARLAANPKLTDVAFVCVSTESAEAINGFLGDKSWTMTMLRATDVPKPFATDGIPATFLIAPDGRIVSTSIGAEEWDTPENVERLVQLAQAK